MKFLHTADWQIGKPFQSIEDNPKREALRKQRIDSVRSLGKLVQDEALDFVVVCGDLFDSATPDKSTVAALCSAVGELKVPVYAIPGNHDHGGPGCIWRQEFFLREQQQLAPNLHIFLEAEPYETEHAVLLPCPLNRRHVTSDPTSWLRTVPDNLSNTLPRIVLAHGSTQGFSSSSDDDSHSQINLLNLDHLPTDDYDYVALGDWHGMKSITQKAWFCGTPEQDRFAKGDSNQPGHVLIVELSGRGAAPVVTPHRTGSIGWHEPAPIQLTSDESLDNVETELIDLLGGGATKDLLKLSIQGTLSLAGSTQLEKLIESLEARTIRLQLENELTIEPSTEELEALTQRQDPLIAQVANELSQAIQSDATARDLLRELHLQIVKAEQTTS
jgi:DNA repair exonuclease SbcCD nuclease subunit